MLRRLITISFGFGLLLLLSSQLWAAADYATITIQIERRSHYTLTPGENTSELVLSMKQYPADLVEQLKSQFNDNFVAVKVTYQDEQQIAVKLILIPKDFRYSHLRKVSPQQLVIVISPPTSDDEQASRKEEIPVLPMWEMLEDSTILLPYMNYAEAVDATTGDTAYLNAIKLFNIAADDAALQLIDKSLATEKGELRQYFQMMKGDILFKHAVSNPAHIEKARRQLASLDQDDTDEFIRSRARLMLGYCALLSKLPRQAMRVFDEGLNERRQHKAFFMMGLLEVALKQDRYADAQKLITALSRMENLPEPLLSKLCFAGMILLSRRGEVRFANDAADRCAAGSENTRFSADQMMALAETRLLSNRFGEAKALLRQVINDYPNHAKLPLAEMRLGDVLVYERRFEEARQQYESVINRHPLGAFTRLAGLKITELDEQREGRPFPELQYKALDLHHEPEPVDRESKLRLMWAMDTAGRNAEAYNYLVDLIRRYQGMRYWAFQPRRFSQIVMRVYDAYKKAGDNLSLISLYQSHMEFPLMEEDRDRIAMMVADAYGAIEHQEEAVKVYLEALERRGREVQGERDILLSLTNSYILMDDAYRAAKTQEYFNSKFKEMEDHRVYHMMMGEIEQMRGNDAASISHYEKAMDYIIDPVEKRHLSLIIARVIYQQKQYKRAITILSPVLNLLLDENVIVERKPISYDVRNAIFNLADCYYMLGNYEQALRVYRRATLLFPEDSRVPIAYYFAAKSSEKLGSIDEAVDFYNKIAAMPDASWKQIGEMQAQTLSWIQKHNLK